MATRSIAALRTAAAPTAVEIPFIRRGWLAGATAGQRARILSMGRRLSLARGTQLFSPGDPPGGIYGVVSGGIAAQGSTAWHAPRMGHVYREGHWFGYGPTLNGGSRTMGYRALEDSSLLHVPLTPLRREMRDDSEMARLVGQLADHGTRLASWVACDLLISSAPRRIAAVLLRVTGAHEGVAPSDPDGFLLTQSEIGEMANASRIHVNRVLGQFTRKGWIAKRYKHLRLLDAPALMRFAYRKG